MKNETIFKLKPTRIYLPSYPLAASLVFLLTIFSQIGYAQAQLSLADILIGLRSKKVTLVERNQLLAEAVIQRGITFALTPEIEKELIGTGADKALVDAIRLKSTPAKPAATPEPTPVPTPKPDAAFYQKRANAHIVKGEFDMAVTEYSKSIELNDGDPSVYLNRGRAFYNKKDYDMAIADYSKAIELNPKESIAYLDRGFSYEKKGNSQQAVSDYQKAVELDSGNESARNNLKRIQDEQIRSLPKPKDPEPAVITEPVKVPESISLGQLTSASAVRMVMPIYSPIAHKMNIQGKVTVEIQLDEKGNVTSAKAVSGHQLLRPSAEDAAKRSKFKPALFNNQPIKATGFIVYSFTNNPSN